MMINRVIIFIYFFWGFIWYIFSRFFRGSLNTPYLPAMHIEDELIFPNSAYLLGTDVYGRDLFQVISEGLVYSLSISFLVVISSQLIALFFSTISIIVKNKILKLIIDNTILTFYIVPGIFYAIIFLSAMKKGNISMFLILTLTSWAGLAKVFQNEIIRINSLSYIEGHQALGPSKFRLVVKSFLPELYPQMVIHMIGSITGVILSEATLSFLGLGGNEYSWGFLLNESRSVLLEAPYLTLIISCILFIFIFNLNLLTKKMRKNFDEK